MFFESFRKSRNPFSKGFLVGCRGKAPARQTRIYFFLISRQ